MVFDSYKFSSKSIKKSQFRNIAKKKVRGTKSLENDFRFWGKVLAKPTFFSAPRRMDDGWLWKKKGARRGRVAPSMAPTA